jgi:hypothetical protein
MIILYDKKRKGYKIISQWKGAGKDGQATSKYNEL